jgi:hypothetical protein
MHVLRHPRNALIVGGMFVAIAIVYWAAPYFGNGHVDFAGLTLLGALGVAMALMAYVLVAGSPRD